MQKRPIARGNRAARRSGSAPTAVFLVGFMGAGKTTVGRLMAEKLGWEFSDLDECIERRAGRSVASIFRASGEAAFRDLEHSELRRLIASARSGGGLIAALGGGAMAQPRNLSLLRRHDFPVVYLDAPVETLRRRCVRQARLAGTRRPLLGTASEFRDRYARRRQFYRQASLRKLTTGRRPSTIATQLIATLRLAPAGRG